MIILAIGTMVLGVTVFILIKGMKGYAVEQKEIAEPVKTPCDYGFDEDVVFNGMWIGMPKSVYNHKEESIEYKPEIGREGKIKWGTEWTDGFLSKLVMKFEAVPIFNNQGSEMTETMDKLLAMSAWKQMWEPRLGSCQHEKPAYDPDGSIMICDRVRFEFSALYNAIVVSDGCLDDVKSREKKANDSIEIAKSKSLFH